MNSGVLTFFSRIYQLFLIQIAWLPTMLEGFMGLSQIKWRSCILMSVIFFFFIFISSQTIFAVNVAFTYDASGRLLAAQYGDGLRIAYAYDSVGNMTQQLANGVGDGGLIGPVLQLLLAEEQSVSAYCSVLGK